MSESENGKEQDGFGQWCILEVMGHRKLGGYVTEQPLFGTAMLRIDIPSSSENYVTEYYGGSSIYALHPVTEEVARAFAARSRVRPVEVYELALPEPKMRPIQGVQDALGRYGFSDEEGEAAGIFDPEGE